MTNDINSNSSISDLLGGGSSGNSYIYDSRSCSYRLPCGYCTRLCQPCPMMSTSITWGVNSTPPINYCGGPEA